MNKQQNLVKKITSSLFEPLRAFFKDSRSIGMLLICSTIISLLLANWSVTSISYTSFWLKEINTGISFLHLPENNLLFVNDVLMTFFFFLVGMEIKRELTIGELASIKKSMLPVVAALGGMLFPAAIFVIINHGTPFQRGWGIPMATDIAFSLGILSLLGKKVPIQLKIFLTALAIIDDLGAVITIAVFYSSQIKILYLLAAASLAIIVVVLNKLKVNKLFFYIISGILLWYCMFNSGIHATVAGVILAFCMPLNLLVKLEHKLFYPVNFLIMPLFAFANTAIILPIEMGFVFTSTISFGIIAGLVIGKPLGIFLFSFGATKLKITSLPSNTSWKQLLGVGMLSGIGFTMSIFTAALSYSLSNDQIISKIAIIAASAISGILGFGYLYKAKNRF